MAKRISEFPEVVVPNGAEELPIAYQGRTFRIKLGNIASLIPLPTKAQIGLGNVDNTSDQAKPVSAATQAALDGKANTTHSHTEAEVVGLVQTLSGINSQIIGVLDQVQTLGTQVFGLNNTVNNMGSRVTAVETKADALEVTVGQQTNAIASINSSLTAFNTRINTTANDLVQLNSSVTLQFGALNTTINTINTELANHESRIDILEQEIIGDTPTVILVQAGW